MVAKPFYGILSDSLYIFGQHRVPYIALGAPGLSGGNLENVEAPRNQAKGSDFRADVAHGATDTYHFREMQRRQVEFVKKRVLFLEKGLATEELLKEHYANENTVPDDEPGHKVRESQSPISIFTSSRDSGSVDILMYLL
ncbi:hypothetical protein ACS0TY_013305 [Phlomoides rotata]